MILLFTLVYKICTRYDLAANLRLTGILSVETKFYVSKRKIIFIEELAIQQNKLEGQ